MTARTKEPTATIVILSIVVAITALFSVGVAAAGTGWSAAANLETIAGTSSSLNTADIEGCPNVSRDDRKLYLASDRPDGFGKLDLYVSERADPDDPWGPPVNLGPVINTAEDDFCPTSVGRSRLMFVSKKPGGCGGADIYTSRFRKGAWAEPRNLGCTINSAADEASPFPVDDDLYFSSTRPGGHTPDAPGATFGDSDIYVVEMDDDEAEPVLVPGLNSDKSDARPNVRRDGLEIFFDSDRPGSIGLADIWTATRDDDDDAWSTPMPLGSEVNSAASETRPSISWDGSVLYFGSTRPGGDGKSDLYFTTRDVPGDLDD